MEKKRKLRNINKSVFIRFFESDFLVWLSNIDNFQKIEGINQFLPEWHEISNDPKEAIESSVDENDNIEEKKETVYDGDEVGTMARIYFQSLNYKEEECRDFDDKIFSQKLVKETKEAISNKKYKVMFEAGFQFKNFTLRPDILIRNNDDTFDIIEVKASSNRIFEEGKTFKDKYILDIFYQYTIMKKLGYKIRNVKLMVLDADYIYNNNLDLNELFSIHDEAKTSKFNFLFHKNKNEKPSIRKKEIKFLEVCEKLEQYFENDILEKINIIYYNKFYESSSSIQNENDIVRKFFDLESNPKQYQMLWMSSDEATNLLKFYTYKLFKNKINDKMDFIDSIFNFYFMKKKDKIKHINYLDGKTMSKIILGTDIVKKNDSNWRLQIEAVKFDLKAIVNLQKVESFLKDNDLLDSQLIFYDFESFKSPIPFFNNTKVYQQICFQYSIHYANDIKDLMEKNMKESKNTNYVQRRNENYNEFIHKFIDDIYNKLLINMDEKKYRYIVYHKTFETSRIKEMINHLQKTEAKDGNLENNIEKLEFINNNTVDLKDLFQKFHIWFKDFKNSVSIKKVLPALVEELSYNDLDIQNGSLASWEYRKYFLDIDRDVEDENLIIQLKEYCKLDTWSMLALLREVIKIYAESKKVYLNEEKSDLYIFDRKATKKMNKDKILIHNYEYLKQEKKVKSYFYKNEKPKNNKNN